MPSGLGASPLAVVPTRGEARAEAVMGTVVTVDVRDVGVPASALDAVFAWFQEVDRVFSTFREDSEISRLSRGALSEGDCRGEVREVLALCDEVERRSRGRFNIRCGGRLDPSGLVKGWSAERAVALLLRAGARNFLVDAGGDLVARGRPDPQGTWRLGIRHPEIPDQLAAALAIGDLAVATSGCYERGPHILDPRTGRPPQGLLSMTVVGPSLTYADAYATAAFVMGEVGVAWVAGIEGYDALAITADRRTVWSEGMDPLLVED